MNYPDYDAGKAEALMSALDGLTAGPVATEVAEQPVPAAGPATTSKPDITELQKIEASVRGALALFGIDYDAYINYAPTAAYGMALASNPALVERIGRSEMPLVEALRIALAYAPYAEFAAKYGNNPDDIRNAIRKEVEQEQGANSTPEPTAAERLFNSRLPAFSSAAGVAAPKAAGSEPKSGLDALFNRR
ncbi:MAG: hypothetical protein GC134_01875 [Proteobacteria bacterium]|nr:hypothetical protein [Pseudomonadota bacterium]